MQIWSEDYKINSYLVNLQGRAGLSAVLNFIQDVGMQHGVRLNVNFADKNLLWVFTRQKLVMQRWPQFNEVITIKTWLRPVTHFVYRDFELFVGEEKVGFCTSSFTVINGKTRKIENLDFTIYREFYRTDYQLDLQPHKIPLHEDVETLAEFQVRNSDIDLNNHVNNTKYAQWILVSLPIDRLRIRYLHEYEINFIAEAKIGDKISIQRHEHRSDGAQILHFQGLRLPDNKAVFSALMKVSELAGKT